MMKYKQQIKEYKEEIEEKYVRIEAENITSDTSHSEQPAFSINVCTAG